MVQYKLAWPILFKTTKMLTKRNTSDAQYAIVATLKVFFEAPKLTKHLKTLQWIVHALESRKMLF